MTTSFQPIKVPVVFAEVESTGRHSALTTMPLHEAVIARQQIEESGESLIIRDTWAEFAASAQVAQRFLGEEYARLQRTYGKERLVAVYGAAHDQRLRNVILRIHEAFTAHKQKPSKIIEIGGPSGDFIELAPGASIQSAAGEHNLHVAKAPEQNVESSELSAINAEAETPEGVDELGSDATPEEAPIDGALISFLADNGWNDVQANAMARLVRDKGIRSIADADIVSIQGIRNAEARKSMRQHLTEFVALKAKVAV